MSVLQPHGHLPPDTLLQAHRHLPPDTLALYSGLQRGDQVAVEGEVFGIKYFHHGICLGPGKGIADLGGKNKWRSKPRIVDLLQFTDSGRRQLVRIAYPAGQCLAPEIVAENAEKMVAHPTLWGTYDLFTNNCEHFATKCKTGIATSSQVTELLTAWIVILLQLFGLLVVSSPLSGYQCDRFPRDRSVLPQRLQMLEMQGQIKATVAGTEASCRHCEVHYRANNMVSASRTYPSRS